MVYRYNYKTLKTFKFQKKKIEGIEKCKSYLIIFHKLNQKEIFIYIPKEKKYIYTNDEAIIEFYFNKIPGKCYFPYLNINLIKKYYEKKESIYLEEKRKIHKGLFDKIQSKTEFKESEIKWAKEFDIFKEENYKDILVIIKYYEKRNGYDFINNQVSEYLKWLTTPYYGKNLEDLFKKKYVNSIIELMKKIKIIDNDKKCILGQRNMAPLSAMIIYMTSTQKKFQLLTLPHTRRSTSLLLTYFNRYLGTSFKSISTKGHYFKSSKEAVNQYFIEHFS